MSPSLEGKVAVVTGASRGLGRDVAAALADAGARTAERFPCDVSRLDEVERLRARVEAELGPPQILVNVRQVPGESDTHWREGFPLRDIRDLLGHANVSTTDTYLRGLGASSAVERTETRT
jgi:NAD(P)-dependent dehydrogenase (short-subunit alcohol dehydrogenase family)